MNVQKKQEMSVIAIEIILISAANLFKETTFLKSHKFEFFIKF